jgi:hypothetical protein
MLILVLHFYIVSFGLGWAGFLFGDESKKNQIGLQLFIGFTIIPLFMGLLNLAFRVPLEVSALIVSVVGGFLAVINLIQSRSKLKKMISHPVLTYGLLVALIYYCFGPKNYFATSWDEFSHWMTMPKQMFLHKEIYDGNFLVRTFYSYLPGWPLLLIFHDLVFGIEFNTTHALYCVLISSIFCCGAIYDLSRRYFSDSYQAIQYLRAEFVFPLIVCWIVLVHSFLPINVTIELPLYHVHLIFFLYIGVLYREQKTITGTKIYTSMWTLGVIVAYAYWLKQTSITLVPLLVLFCITYLVGTGWHRIKKIIIYSIAATTPFLIFYLIWHHHIESKKIEMIFSVVKPSNLGELLNQVFHRSHLILKMFKRLWSTFFGLHILEMFSVGYFFYAYKRRLLDSTTANFILFFCVFYLACLMWMYMTAFGDFEANQLASFSRYMSIPIVVLGFFGANAFLVFAFKTHWFETFSRKTKLFSVILIILVTLVVSIYVTTVRVIKNPMYRDYEVVLQILEKYKLNRPRVLFVSQGGNQFEFYIGRYLSIGPKSYLYDVDMSGTSFGKFADNVWRTVISDDKMLNIINQNDIIWIVKSDDWMDQNLARLKLKPHCRSPFDGAFLVRTADGFDCIEKQ